MGASHLEQMVAHTGRELVISALIGQRIKQLHQCGTMVVWITDSQLTPVAGKDKMAVARGPLRRVGMLCAQFGELSRLMNALHLSSIRSTASMTRSI
jgi:hypothetical protein